MPDTSTAPTIGVAAAQWEITGSARYAAAFALAAVGGILLAFAYSNNPLAWAAWAAPVPALAAMLVAPPRLRLLVGLMVGLLAGALSFDYRVTTGSVTAAVVIAAAYAVAWSSTLGLAARVAERWGATAAMFVLPTAWAAIDTLLIHFSPHGSIGSLAYSQGDVLPVLQLASLGGVPAISFVLLLPGSTAGLALAKRLGRADLAGVRGAAILAAALVSAALLFGWTRLVSVPTETGTTVAMISSDRKPPPGRGLDRFHAVYGAALDSAARPGVIVLLPEAVLRVDAEGLVRATDALALLARTRRATIVVGAVVDEDGVSTNRALVALPDGRLATYDKQHLVPGLETDLTPGHRNLLIASPVPGTGIAICKDMHFPTLGRSYALDGARVMLVPANDFNVDDRMMMAVAAMRGIEGGYVVARNARNGMSSVSDPFGRILAERRSKEATGTLTAALPAGLPGTTLYSRVGDLFGWLCFAVWACLRVVIRTPERTGNAALPAT